MLIFLNIILIILLVWAAISDLRARIIPNAIPLLAIVLFPLGALLGLVPAWPMHLLIFALSFALAVALFAFGIMGGGDAKLIPAMALWAGPSGLSLFVLIMALSGGILALIMIIRQKNRNNSDSSPDSFPDSSLEGVPYGVAIACGGIAFLLPPFLAFLHATPSGV
ncbi:MULTISPECIES: prepilin peptidase [unclassified Iodidimonas]|jgi:prepilin peptidase CpaA|uniref:A24 family peptidase n=1 Tax=unclassified Iodidimonas TaxID=2626145 RepID=UPI0024826FCE|nr:MULTISPECIES: prepilin peptidase [unclassified Iodidimonas]